jgi:chitin synthase
MQSTSLLVGYDWEQVAVMRDYLVIDGSVLNMGPYMKLHPTAIPGDEVDIAIRTVLRTQASASGKDGTRLFYHRPDLQAAVPCLKQRYHAGNIDKITPGCFAANLLLYAGLVVILTLVVIRFIMACVFNWFLSARLAGPPDSRQLNRKAISPSVMPEGANVSVDNRTGTAPWASGKKLGKSPSKKMTMQSASSTTLINSDTPPVMNLAQIGPELFAVCLVTCYSEGEESLRTTLDSISLTDYPDSRKLLFVVADGMITGAGETKSTPDICVGLLEADPRFGNPIPMAYGSIGTGAKCQNRAMVYAGHYSAYLIFPSSLAYMVTF